VTVGDDLSNATMPGNQEHTLYLNQQQQDSCR
jgi:hypothetical protein